MPHSLVRDNVATLQQAEDLLFGNEQPDMRFGPRIGPHLRHVLDHYDCFLAGLNQGLINYDARERDTACEDDMTLAQQRLHHILGRLEVLDPDSWPPVVQIAQATAADGETRLTGSTPGRELQFLQNHAVHHFALIRLLLEQTGKSLPDDFGKAPSTVRFERTEAEE